MIGFLALGFLIGLTHAFEADHLAAMASLAAERRRGTSLLARGAAWGVGHTVTLFLICGAVLVFGAALTETRAAQLEFGVGVMLVAMGANILWQMRRRKIHFHVHAHGQTPPHLHAHSHAGAEVPHHRDPHEHAHPARLPWRALAVGLVHGAAGSAGLLALAGAAAESPLTSLLYVLIFGVGSIVGMSLLTLVVSRPLRLAERRAARLHLIFVSLAGGVAVLIGVQLMVRTAATAFETFPFGASLGA